MFGDQIWAKKGQKLGGFCHLLKFGSLVFLQFAYNDSLEQSLTASRDKTCKKNWGPNFGPNERKSDPKSGFLSFFLVWFISFL